MAGAADRAEKRHPEGEAALKGSATKILNGSGHFKNGTDYEKYSFRCITVFAHR